MFDPGDVRKLLKLHEKSFGLFMWLNTSMRGGKRSMSGVSEALSFSEAAAAWIQASNSNIPRDFRPEPDEREPMAHLFASYLATSFEVVDRSAVRACPGCWCCIYWIESKHLRTRDPDKKARAMAHDLKILYLRQLSEELELPLLDAELEKFLDTHRDLWSQLALATYFNELRRRSKFASQGEGVLSIWRELTGASKKKFVLKAENIVQAEKDLKARMEKSIQ